MTNYLVKSGDKPEHYFFAPYEGICVKGRAISGLWQKQEQVIRDARDGFGVYADKNGNVHIICIDGENRLVYAVRRGGEWKKYTLCELSKEIYVSDMRLYNVAGRLNLLYSALYNGETMLVHCILGNHAKPATVGVTETAHFYIYDNKVYYTNADGQLGFVSLADEKPSGFSRLYDDAHYCTVCELGGKEMLLFTRQSRLFINGEEILYDSRMEMPSLVKGSDRAYVMWKSGSFVRYIASFNGGTTWSEPMRFMSTGRAVSSYIAQQGESVNYYYGYHSERELTLLGAGDIFAANDGFQLPPPNELERLKVMLDMTRREVIDTKKEIVRLNTAIEGLKGLK